MNLSVLPAVNATLNSICAALLITGVMFIRRKAITQHRVCMSLACLCSLLFLTSYLFYHYHHGSTAFQGQGAIRTVYFSILISHTILAIIIVPFVIMTLLRAIKGNFEKHAKIARITFPMWLYVSVTGVVIYWMLYQMKWTAS